MHALEPLDSRGAGAQRAAQRRGALSAHDAGAGGDPRPLGGYAALLGTYVSLAGTATLLLRKRRRTVAPISALDLVVYGLATEHLSRLVTKDSVTAVVRHPFTRFEGAAGEGEVNEEVVGTGLRHAVGELITCPFCIAQWVASALVVGRLAAPNFTRAAATACALARLSDHLQLLYGLNREAL